MATNFISSCPMISSTPTSVLRARAPIRPTSPHGGRGRALHAGYATRRLLTDRFALATGRTVPHCGRPEEPTQHHARRQGDRLAARPSDTGVASRRGGIPPALIGSCISVPPAFTRRSGYHDHFGRCPAARLFHPRDSSERTTCSRTAARSSRWLLTLADRARGPSCRARRSRQPFLLSLHYPRRTGVGDPDDGELRNVRQGPAIYHLDGGTSTLPAHDPPQDEGIGACWAALDDGVHRA